MFRGMMQNHYVAKSIGEVSFYSFKKKLEWKAEK